MLVKMNNREYAIFGVWIPMPYKSTGQWYLVAMQSHLNICGSKALAVSWLHKPFREVFLRQYRTEDEKSGIIEI